MASGAAAAPILGPPSQQVVAATSTAMVVDTPSDRLASSTGAHTDTEMKDEPKTEPTGTSSDAAAAGPAPAEIQPAPGDESAGVAPPLDAPVTPLNAEWSWEADAPPSPSGGDGTSVSHRYSAPIAACVTCFLCNDLLREAWTRVSCGHSFCYECIRRFVEDEGNQFCPECRNPQAATYDPLNARLGAAPFGVLSLEGNAYVKKESEIMYDEALDSIVRTVFPRPILQAWLNSNREEFVMSENAEMKGRTAGLARGLRTREQRDSGRRQQERPAFQELTADQLAPVPGKVNLAVFPYRPEAETGAAAEAVPGGDPPVAKPLPNLERPYLHTSVRATVADIQGYILQSLAASESAADCWPEHGVDLVCKGVPLDPELTVGAVYEHHWAAASMPGHDAVRLTYSTKLHP